MNWHLFPWAAALVFTLQGISALLVSRRRSLAVALLASSGVVLAAFLAAVWIGMDRPPLRTYGETRLAYAAGLALLSAASAKVLRRGWPVVWGALLGAVFTAVTLLSPESHDRTLMPALRSPWFVPHVTVYLLGYAAATIASFSAAMLWLRPGTARARRDVDGPLELAVLQLTCGLLFGALWAKEAWGSYWTWDPKETWAFLTWSCYVAALHLRRASVPRERPVWILLTAGWLVLLLAWFAVDLFPGGVNSVHVYTR